MHIRRVQCIHCSVYTTFYKHQPSSAGIITHFWSVSLQCIIPASYILITIMKIELFTIWICKYVYCFILSFESCSYIMGSKFRFELSIAYDIMHYYSNVFIIIHTYIGWYMNSDSFSCVPKIFISRTLLYIPIYYI